MRPGRISNLGPPTGVSGKSAHLIAPSEARVLPELAVLSYGGGQDSTSILIRLAYDRGFRRRYAPGRLLVVMSDTGDEHRETYRTVEWAREFCRKNDIPFAFLEAGDEYHSRAWADLRSAYRRFSNCGSKSGYKKTCTVNLKVAPIYRFLEVWIGREYGLEASKKNTAADRWGPKKALPAFARKYGRVRVMLGFAAGEEKRVDPKAAAEKWRRECISYSYPLLDLGWDRAACQKYIRAADEPIPAPSNCIICPFLDARELLLLSRDYPEDFKEWVEFERIKLRKWSHLGAKNYGVNGRKTLPETLTEAVSKYGNLTTEELREHRFSHGHCTMSKY